jgi:hypothetical protein
MKDLIPRPRSRRLEARDFRFGLSPNVLVFFAMRTGPRPAIEMISRVLRRSSGGDAMVYAPDLRFTDQGRQGGH